MGRLGAKVIYGGRVERPPPPPSTCAFAEFVKTSTLSSFSGFSSDPLKNTSQQATQKLFSAGHIPWSLSPGGKGAGITGSSKLLAGMEKDRNTPASQSPKQSSPFNSDWKDRIAQWEDPPHHSVLFDFSSALLLGLGRFLFFFGSLEETDSVENG